MVVCGIMKNHKNIKTVKKPKYKHFILKGLCSINVDCKCVHNNAHHTYTIRT